jgi:hypothetical protein
VAFPEPKPGLVVRYDGLRTHQYRAAAFTVFGADQERQGDASESRQVGHGGWDWQIEGAAFTMRGREMRSTLAIGKSREAVAAAPRVKK